MHVNSEMILMQKKGVIKLFLILQNIFTKKNLAFLPLNCTKYVNVNYKHKNSQK